MLFATRFDEAEGWHDISAPAYGDRRVDGPEERRNLVAKFENARENQINPVANPDFAARP